MGSAVPKVQGPDYAVALFRHLQGLAQASIAQTGDIDVEPICEALELALSDPMRRDDVIQLAAQFIACCLTGVLPDLPE